MIENRRKHDMHPDDLLHDISHSLQNAIAGIIFASQELPPEYKSLKNKIYNDGKTVQKGIRRLIKLAGSGAEKEQMSEELNFKENIQQVSDPEVTAVLEKHHLHYQNTGKTKVLVAEDDPVFCAAILKILKNEYDVGVTYNGKEAWRLIKRESPDLIISDIIMPVMNGYELCREVRQSSLTENIPFIFVSGRTGSADRVNGLKEGADYYFAKHFMPQELLIVIRSLLYKKNLYDDLNRLISKLKKKDSIIRSDNQTLEAKISRQTQLLSRTIEELNANEKLGLNMISHAAHELETPLAAIQMNASMLVYYKDRFAQQFQDTHESIYRGAKSLQTKLRDILDSSKHQKEYLESDIKKIDIHEIINDVKALYQNQIEDNNQTIKINSGHDASINQVSANKKEIFRLLANIIGNAVKYTPFSGTILIRVENHAPGLKISVVDNGPGIAEQDLPKVFMPLFRSNEFQSSIEGTGIGLSIAKTIIEKHKGRIRACSPVEKNDYPEMDFPDGCKGAAFVIFLPDYWQQVSLTDEFIKDKMDRG